VANFYPTRNGRRKLGVFIVNKKMNCRSWELSVLNNAQHLFSREKPTLSEVQKDMDGSIYYFGIWTRDFLPLPLVLKKLPEMSERLLRIKRGSRVSIPASNSKSYVLEYCYLSVTPYSVFFKFLAITPF